MAFLHCTTVGGLLRSRRSAASACRGAASCRAGYPDHLLVLWLHPDPRSELVRKLLQCDVDCSWQGMCLPVPADDDRLCTAANRRRECNPNYQANPGAVCSVQCSVVYAVHWLIKEQLFSARGLMQVWQELLVSVGGLDAKYLGTSKWIEPPAAALLLRSGSVVDAAVRTVEFEITKEEAAKAAYLRKLQLYLSRHFSERGPRTAVRPQLLLL